jgi:hypothetical protein
LSSLFFGDDTELQRLVVQLEKSMDASSWTLVSPPRRTFSIEGITIPEGEIAGRWTLCCLPVTVGGRRLFADAILIGNKIVSVGFTGKQIDIDDPTVNFVKTSFAYNPALPQFGEEGLGSGSCS